MSDHPVIVVLSGVVLFLGCGWLALELYDKYQRRTALTSWEERQGMR